MVHTVEHCVDLFQLLTFLINDNKAEVSSGTPKSGHDVK